MQGWIMDLVIGVCVSDAGSILVSVLLGWLYSKYHRRKIEQQEAKKEEEKKKEEENKKLFKYPTS